MSWRGFLYRTGIRTVNRAINLIGAGGGFGAKLLGAGTNASRATIDAANSNFLSFYLKNKATTGDNRGMYLRHYANGGSSDAARIFATADDDVTSIFGTHSSVSFAATKEASGLACGLRATWHIPNHTIAAGTYCALQVEAYCDGTSADPSNLATHSLIRAVVDGGDAASQGKVLNLLDLVCKDGSNLMVHTGQNEPTWAGKTALIQCRINGVKMYLIAVDPSA